MPPEGLSIQDQNWCSAGWPSEHSIAVFTLDAGLPARSQYSEGPVTDQLDTGLS